MNTIIILGKFLLGIEVTKDKLQTFPISAAMFGGTKV